MANAVCLHTAADICVLSSSVQVSPEGEVLQVLLDPTGVRVATSSAATEFNGRLFLGNLMAGPYISYVELSEAQQMEQHLLQQQRQQAGLNATAAGDGGVDWSAVGGKSLHAQQDVWGRDAAMRHKRM
jgi:hypothetical protein